MSARSTGVDIIDEVLGGITPGLPCVISGPSGSGRTVLSLQLAAAGVEQDRSVALLCNEPAPLLLRQAASLGLDLGAAIETEQLALLEMDSEIASLTGQLGGDVLIESVRSEQPDCSLLLIDPLSVITAGFFDEAQLRAMARGLVAHTDDWLMVLTVESERLAVQQGLERILGEICGDYVSLSCDRAGHRHLVVEKTRTGIPKRDHIGFAIAEGGTHPIEFDVSARSDPAGSMTEGMRPRSLRDDTTKTAFPRSSISPEASDPDIPKRVGKSHTHVSAGLQEAPPRPVILVVDSDRQARDQMAKWLEGPYEVIAVDDGFDAMTWLMAHPPDLVVLDLLLPRVTGYELLSALQRGQQTFPRLVISGRVERAADRLAPLVLGATDILRKPVDRLDFVRKVEMLLRLDGAPPDLMDPAEAGDLFATISKTRLLGKPDFHERLSRASSLGDRLELPSSLITVSSDSSSALDHFLESADPSLRFEDATFRVSQRRAVILLVATAQDDALGAAERLCEEFESGGGQPEQLTLRLAPVRPVSDDFEWHSLFRERGGAKKSESSS